MWRSGLVRSPLHPNLFHRLGNRALSLIGGVVGLFFIFVGLALAGFYSNWFTSSAAAFTTANLPFSISGILLIGIGLAVLILA
jgi:hypothetical protein